MNFIQRVPRVKPAPRDVYEKKKRCRSNLVHAARLFTSFFSLVFTSSAFFLLYVCLFVTAREQAALLMLEFASRSRYRRKIFTPRFDVSYPFRDHGIDTVISSLVVPLLSNKKYIRKG